MKSDKHLLSNRSTYTRTNSRKAIFLTKYRIALMLAVAIVVLAGSAHLLTRQPISAAGPNNIVFALTNSNQLLRFAAGAPGTVIGTPVTVTGLQPGETLVGIDFRPATGELFGMGVAGALGRIYVINPVTGAAIQPGGVGSFALPQSAGVAAGGTYGFDFNPTVDRIRVVADSRDNFRLNPNNGAIAGADTALGVGAQISGAAYDRNFNGTAQTTLFAIDFNTDQLVLIGGANGTPSPNGGTVTPVGSLGVNTGSAVGFDIAGDLPAPGSAYASLTVGATPNFYTINLGTGAATLVGAIGNGATPITDIAVAPGGVLRFATPTYTAIENSNLATITVNRTGGAFGAASVTVSTANGTAIAGADYTATTTTLNFADGVMSQTFSIPVLNDAAVEGNETVILNFSNYNGCGMPGPAGLLTITDDDDGASIIWAIDAANNLLRFSADTPGTTISSVAVTGLQPNERLVGIDFRPATGQLFAMGVLNNGGRLYTLNLGTGAATLVGVGFTLPQSPAVIGVGTDFGFDFNPTVDRIRVVANNTDNFRLHPETGGIAGADTALTAGSVITGAAYDRNYVASPQPTTTLYGIDSNTDQLVTIGGINGTPSPNLGAVTSVGALGVNTTNSVGFDIINGAEGTAYALLTPVPPLAATAPPALFTISLATGAATPIGVTATGFPVVDIAAATAGTVQLSVGAQIISEAAGTVTVTVTRTGGANGSITLNFPEGVTSRTFTIPIINDSVDEPDQAFNVTLSANVGGRITAPATQTITIADDDTSAVSINDILVAEGNVGNSNAIFTVTLSNSSTSAITVNFATSAGTATANNDYLTTAGTVTFAPGVVSQTFAVPVVGDSDFEADETFFVNLTNNNFILDGQGQATIVNDDVSGGPGTGLLTENSVMNDQKAGSILIYPVYTSGATDSNTQNTRFSITNVDNARSINVHLFLVDGATCSVSDTYICLTQNQTATFLASDLDPGQTGYLIAIAVNQDGCPVLFNALIGDAYVKFPTGHAANLGAEAIAGLSGLVNSPLCSVNTPTVVLPFDGIVYQPLPRTLAADNLPDRASGNDTLLIIDRIGGNLSTGAASLGAIFGIIYDDTEDSASFGFSTSQHQFRSSLSNNFPRITPRYEQFIPANRSGWLKLWADSDFAIIGATINFNPNTASSSNAFNQGHNLHILRTTTSATLTLPVFPPSCN
jgi:hypothetical protein